MSSKDGRHPKEPIGEAARTRARMAREMARLEGQGEKVAGGDGFARPGDDAPDDPIELWGRRIGRTLGYAFALYLIWHLLSTYVLK